MFIQTTLHPGHCLSSDRGDPLSESHIRSVSPLPQFPSLPW